MEPMELKSEDIVRGEKVIGKGAFGHVFIGMWKTVIVAIKKFNGMKSNASEASHLARASHPNIVRIYGTYCQDQCCYLVMEFADCGSLDQTLQDCDPSFTNAHSLSWARQCAEGIAYLHAMKPKPLIHRDIKPANLLLFRNRTLLKIGDFGFARDLSNEMTDRKGSAAWMAPEVFTTTSYNEKCDVYSWAMVLWQILSLEQPFKECKTYLTLITWVDSGRRPSTDLPTITPALRTILHRCWQQDPDLRPAMEAVVEEMTSLCDESPADGVDEPLPLPAVERLPSSPSSSSPSSSCYESARSGTEESLSSSLRVCCN